MECTVEYLIKLDKWARDNTILPVNGYYNCNVPIKDMRYPKCTRWHYQQRRVRVRREKHQKRIDQMLRAHPYGKVVSIKERGRKVIGVLLNEYTK